jgi:hypothetical protein
MKALATARAEVCPILTRPWQISTRGAKNDGRFKGFKREWHPSQTTQFVPGRTFK